MSKILALAETENNAVAVRGSTLDPFEAYANAVAPKNILGSLMKFSKGDYLAGEEGKAIETGTTVTANLDELLAGWIKWKEGKPVEQRMVRVADGVPPPRRDDLGDEDPTSWELDNNGQAKDCWQFTNYLPLMNAEGELFTFTTSSRGGLSAVADLSRRYGRHRYKHPDVHPVHRAGCRQLQARKQELRDHQDSAVHADGLGAEEQVQRSTGCDRCGWW